MPSREAFLDNSYYHVCNRGNNKQKLFINKYDYEHFYSLVEIHKKNKKFKILEYSLLPNHFHFLFHTTSYGYHISRFIGVVCGSYAKYFVAKYGNTKGKRIFEGNFRSKHINNDLYLEVCKTYVCFNPIKHELVSNIKDRKYTSFHDRDTDKISSLEKGIISKHFTDVLKIEWENR